MLFLYKKLSWPFKTGTHNVYITNNTAFKELIAIFTFKKDKKIVV